MNSDNSDIDNSARPQKPKGLSVLSVITGAVSGVFITIGFGYLFYLVPLQFAASKTGKRGFIHASAIAAVLGTLGILFRYPGLDAIIAISGTLGFLAALWIINVGIVIPGRNITAWQKLLSAVIVSSLAVIAALLAFYRQDLWTVLQEGVTEIPEFRDFLLELIPGMNLNELFDLLERIVYRSAVLSSGIVLLLAYAIGRAIARGGRDLPRSLYSYELPAWFIWSVIGTALVVMASESAGIEAAAIVGWNLLLTALLMYFIQGLAIVSKIAGRRPALRAALPAIIIVSILVPFLNVAMPVLVTILGISSIWIRYSHGTAANGGSAGSGEE